MGILGLSKLIADVAPEAIKENEIKNYFGRKVAIDASMSLYQFLIAGNICTKCSITSLSEIRSTYMYVKLFRSGQVFFILHFF